MTKIWDELLKQVQSWPEEAQQELVQVASEIQAELNESAYRATAEELAGIERGLSDAAAGKFVASADVERVFAKYRG